MAIDPDSIKFNQLYSKEQIEKRVKELGEKISADFGNEQLIVVSVLKGSFIFAADLVRHISIPLTMEFVGIKSYEGMTSTGKIQMTHDISTNIEGKNVLIVEDIVDTGFTMAFLLKKLGERKPKSLKLCTLLTKPDALQTPVKVDYFGFSISKEFVIGYGLDLDGRWRELPYIAQVVT